VPASEAHEIIRARLSRSGCLELDPEGLPAADPVTTPPIRELFDDRQPSPAERMIKRPAALRQPGPDVLDRDPHDAGGTLDGGAKGGASVDDRVGRELGDDQRAVPAQLVGGRTPECRWQTWLTSVSSAVPSAVVG
jgi:hypothetical protein